MKPYALLIGGILLTALGVYYLTQLVLSTAQDYDPFRLGASGLLALITGFTAVNFGLRLWRLPRDKS